MPLARSWNQHNGRPTGVSNWLEITLLILIGLMIFLLACQAIIQPGGNHAATFYHAETSGEQTKLLFNIGQR